MSKTTIIWILLSALTLFAFLIGWFKLTSLTIISALLISTFIKGQLISDFFMDLRNVKFKYRIIPTIWIFSVLSIIAIFYYNPA